MTVSRTTSEPPRGDAFDILGSYRRRLVLATVSGADDPVAISRLAAELTAVERDMSAQDVTDEARRRNEIRLHHADIPSLTAAGLVHYDPQERTVESGDLPLEGREWLDMPVVEALEAWNGPRSAH